MRPYLETIVKTHEKVKAPTLPGLNQTGEGSAFTLPGWCFSARETTFASEKSNKAEGFARAPLAALARPGWLALAGSIWLPTIGLSELLRSGQLDWLTRLASRAGSPWPARSGCQRLAFRSCFDRGSSSGLLDWLFELHRSGWLDLAANEGPNV